MKIKKLYDQSEGDYIAPVTHPRAVLDEKGYDEYARTNEAIEGKIEENRLVNESKSAEISREVCDEVGATAAAKLLKTKYPNLLLSGTRDDRKINSDGEVSAGNGYCKAIKIKVKADTCYYINRPYDRTGASINYAIWLEDEDGNISKPLLADGTESIRGYLVYQIFQSCGVIRTRQDSAYMHVSLRYGNHSADENITANEYCIEYNHPVLKDEYYEEPKLADGVALKKQFKVLLIGSSYGQNTICALAPLAIDAGIDITVGNLYAGSISLSDQLSKAINNELWNEYWHMTKYDNLMFGDNVVSSRGCYATVRQVLNDDNWDCVVLMRSASESARAVWTDDDAANLQSMINFIEENCPSHPRIVWNSSFAYPLGKTGSATREAQRQTTDNMMSVCETIKSTIGIDYIPIARALQLCRDDEVINPSDVTPVDLSDGSEHLNNGIGMYITACCCFEFFFKDLFGMSVRTQTKIHTFNELGYRYGLEASKHNQATILTGRYFRQPTLEQSRLIRKYVQIACNE